MDSVNSGRDIALGTTHQSSKCCFAKDNMMVNANWCGVAKQVFGGSTWNGVGTAGYNGFALIGNFGRCLYHLFMTLINICNAPKRGTHGKKFVACLMFIGTNIKNIVYNAIRAIPIIGYPISRGIDMLAEKFYDIPCVGKAMTAMIDFGWNHRFKKNQVIPASSVRDGTRPLQPLPTALTVLPLPSAPPAASSHAKPHVEDTEADALPDDTGAPAPNAAVLVDSGMAK